MHWGRILIAICIFGWLLKHCFILPLIDWEEHEVTGFEFKIRF